MSNLMFYAQSTGIVMSEQHMELKATWRQQYVTMCTHTHTHTPTHKHTHAHICTHTHTHTHTHIHILMELVLFVGQGSGAAVSRRMSSTWSTCASASTCRRWPPTGNRSVLSLFVCLSNALPSFKCRTCDQRIMGLIRLLSRQVLFWGGDG